MIKVLGGFGIVNYQEQIFAFDAVGLDSMWGFRKTFWSNQTQKHLNLGLEGIGFMNDDR